MTLSTGAIINGRYRIAKKLGEGGFGAVYKAWDTRLNCLRALKMNLDSTIEAQKQFQREASILATLDHPNLPMVIDHFIETSGRQYLVMDYIEGEDLESLIIRAGPVDYETAVTWISQVADALDYLHSQPQPVIHRDIKPANIRITPDGRAVLVDFGLVKLYDEHSRTTAGAQAVTEGYAPPEQYGRGNTDARTDIYALGATLYSLLTGHVPTESVQRLGGDKMAPVHQVNVQVTPGVSHSIAQAMALNPAQRYQSASDFKAALAAGAYSGAISGTAVSGAAADGERSTGQAAAKKGGKSGRLGCFVILVLLCAGLYWFVQSDPVGLTEAFVPALSGAVSPPTPTIRPTKTVKTTAEVEEREEEAAGRDPLAANKEAGTLAFGPRSGRLRHQEGDGRLVENSAEGAWRDFLVEAEFHNPYAARTGAWNYGFLFRNEGFNRQLRLVIRSDKTWQLINRVDDNNNVIQNGRFADIEVSENGANKVALVVDGREGKLYINDTFVADLELSARMKAGDILIMTGMDNEEINGKSTRYEAFKVWSLR